MEKEKRHLIMDKIGELQKDYQAKCRKAKEDEDTITAYAMAEAEGAVLRVAYEILTLDKLGKI